MTPEQARQLLEGTTLGPWEVEMHHESRRPDVATFWIAGRTGDQVAEQETLGRHFDVTESDFYLIAAAPRMVAMIAGMTAEYAVQGKAPSSDEWITLSQWSEELPSSELELGITLTYEDTGETYQVDTRIVMRYVTAPQPLGEEQ